MSASLLVDLGNTCQHQTSIAPANGVGSTPASGAIIGQIVDLLHANSYCNLFVAGGPSSGIFQVAVQTSDSTTSGSFTDPTSGLPAGALPTAFLSGGLLTVNSGLWTSGTKGLPVGGVVNSAPLFCSGGFQAAAFIRNGRYARAVVISGGTFDQPVTIGFISNLKTIGSGAGFSYSPSSGSVNV